MGMYFPFWKENQHLNINATFWKDYTLEFFKQLTNRMIRATVWLSCHLAQH